MKIIQLLLPVAVFLSILSGLSAHAQEQKEPECTLYVTGGNANFYMSYFFSGDLAHPKKGWTVKPDTSSSYRGANNLTLYDHGVNEQVKNGLRLTLMGELSTYDNDYPVVVSGFGYMSGNEQCGQPAMSEAYGKIGKNLQKLLKQKLPECTEEVAEAL